MTIKSQDPRKFMDDLAKQMQQGVAPWQIPRSAGFEMPYNPLDGAPYHPYNAIKLLVAAQERGYTDPRWMTYDQAQLIGCQVVEKGAVMIEKYERTERVPEVDRLNGEPVLDEQGNQKLVDIPLKEPRLVTAWLFNASQIEGLPEYERSRPGYSQDRMENMMRTVIEVGRARIEAGAERSFYSPVVDTVNLRSPASYQSRQELHADAIRGLCFWAASNKRLGLNSNQAVGTTAHAKDQIRAEIFCMIAASEYGLPHTPRANTPANDQIVKALKYNADDLRVLAKEASMILNSLGTFDKERQIPQRNRPVSPEPPRIIPRQRLPFVEVTLTPGEEFKAFARDMGITILDKPVLNNEKQQVLDGNGMPVATYQGMESGPVALQNLVTGQSAQWVAKGYHLSGEQRTDMVHAAKIALTERNQELESKYQLAAEKCAKDLADSVPLNPDSRVMPDFLRERSLKVHGLYVLAGETILIPGQDLNGKIWTYQAIAPSGDRTFPAASKTHGCVAMVGGKVEQLTKEPIVILAESYESAAAIHEVSKRPVAIAFSTDNMRTVVQDIKAANPGAEIAIFSDRGSKIANERRDKNLADIQAAVDVRVALPPGSARNFNDVIQKLDHATLKSIVDTNTLKKESKTTGKDMAVRAPQRQAGLER